MRHLMSRNDKRSKIRGLNYSKGGDEKRPFRKRNQMFESNVSQWESQETSRKTSLKATQFQSLQMRLSMLLSQKEKLQTDLEFLEEEPICESITTQKRPKRSNTENFFESLRQHESRNEELDQKILAEEEIYRNNSHEMRKLNSQIRKLDQELKISQTRLKKEEETWKQTEAAVEQLEDKLLQKETKQLQMEEDCGNMKRDLQSITKTLQEESRENYNIVKSRIDELEKILEDETERQAELEEQVRSLEATKRQQEEEKEHLLQKAKDIQENQKQHARLHKELGNINRTLERAKRELQIADERNRTLVEKMQDLLGDDDPGDGTGEMAKLILLSKIESVEQTDMNEQLDELSIENEYNEELKQQMQLLEDTWDLLLSERDKIMTGLQNELSACRDDGYIEMLREEYNKLMRKRAKL